jgi:putative DNA primase/helicase
MSKIAKVSAVIEDEKTNMFSLKIVFQDIYRNQKSIVVPRAQLSDPKRLIAELNNHGAALPPKRKIQTFLQRIIKSEDVAPHKYRAKDFGWQNDGSFVSFTRTLKSDNSNSSKTIAPLSPFTDHLVKNGNLDKWQNTVARNAKYSSPMVFSICTAFAAATLKSSDLNTFGFMLVGPAKTGKSCIQLAAGSVIGFSEEKYLPNFRCTDAALEELTASFNDHVLLINEGELVLGETSEQRAQKLRAFAYRLAEGQSKGFSKTVDRPRSFYRTIFIGSMEHYSTSQQRLTQSNQASGSEVRVFDVLAVTKNSVDVFDRAPKNLQDGKRKKWADDMFNKIHRGAKENSGVAYHPFVTHLIDDQKESRRFLKREADRFFDKIASSSSDAGIRHITKYCSRIVAAGLLARKLKILPWSRKLIEGSAKRCLNRAIKLLPTKKKMFRQALKHLIAEFKVGAIVDLSNKKSSKTALDVAKGYYTGFRKHRVVTIKGQKFIDLIGSNDLAFQLLQQWDKAGLINSRNRKAKACKSVKDFESQTAWPNGKRPRSIQIQWNSKKIKKALR